VLRGEHIETFPFFHVGYAYSYFQSDMLVAFVLGLFRRHRVWKEVILSSAILASIDKGLGEICRSAHPGRKGGHIP